MTRWLQALADAGARGEPAMLVSVAHATGSVPRPAGTVMVVTTRDVCGTIGGGHLEFEALRLARDALAADGSRPLSPWLVRFPLAARLGQCCGGVATLAFAPVAPERSPWLDAALAQAGDGQPFVLLTRIGGEAGPTTIVVAAGHCAGSVGDAALNAHAVAIGQRALAGGGTSGGGACAVDVEAAAAQWPPVATSAHLAPVADRPGVTLLVQVAATDPFAVLVFGNGHVGRALVKVLGALEADVRWIDTREDDFPASTPANTRIVVTDAPQDVLADAPRGAYVVVVTHSHALDYAVIETALARDDWRYVGLIGSRSKRAQFERRLRSRNVAPEAIARVVCPIGTGAGIASKEPGAIAVGVVAELLATREAAAARTRPGTAEAQPAAS